MSEQQQKTKFIKKAISYFRKFPEAYFYGVHQKNALLAIKYRDSNSFFVVKCKNEPEIIFSSQFNSILDNDESK